MLLRLLNIKKNNSKANLTSIRCYLYEVITSSIIWKRNVRLRSRLVKRRMHAQKLLMYAKLADGYCKHNIVRGQFLYLTRTRKQNEDLNFTLIHRYYRHGYFVCMRRKKNLQTNWASFVYRRYMRHCGGKRYKWHIFYDFLNTVQTSGSYNCWSQTSHR